MKKFLPILLQLLAALGLAGGIFALNGENASLRQLATAALVLYLTALFDWYAFFSSLTHTGKWTKLAAGIISALVFVLTWIWLILIVWRENRG
jgi:hypothetical protein